VYYTREREREREKERCFRTIDHHKKTVFFGSLFLTEVRNLHINGFNKENIGNERERERER
jgi:hypothetical protein